MKISAIRSYPIWVGVRNQLVVKVETDQGYLRLGGIRPIRPRESGDRRDRALRRVPPSAATQCGSARSGRRCTTGWSEAHCVDTMPRNPLGPICTAATVRFAAAVANFAWLECRPTPTEHSYLGFDDEEIFPKLLKIDNAHYTVPDESGLGIEVDEKRLMKEVFKFWEAPHLQRRDGSYTNW
jgi:hypothetical protein